MIERLHEEMNLVGVQGDYVEFCCRVLRRVIWLSIWKYGIPIFRDGEVWESGGGEGRVEDQGFSFGGVKFETPLWIC